MQTGFYSSPIGMLQIETEAEAVTSIRIAARTENSAVPDNEFMARVKQELEQYFLGKLTAFSIPLRPNGTQFQQRVWRTLQSIPYGETRSYGEVVKEIGNGKACRAVGMANHTNPILIMIPCHRVIGANGSLTGYAAGIDKKEFLLNLEKTDR